MQGILKAKIRFVTRTPQKIHKRPRPILLNNVSKICSVAESFDFTLCKLKLVFIICIIIHTTLAKVGRKVSSRLMHSAL